jgi:HEPN domain-containing protein
MNNNVQQARRWFEQSGHDARAAEVNRREGFSAIACFLCQQTAEKALKAFLYYQGERPVVGYSTFLLARRCQDYEQGFAALLDVCRSLDRYYIPTRYPNGLPGGIPHEVFTEEDARHALEALERVMALVTSYLPFKVDSR